MFAEGNKTFIEIARFLYKFGLTRKNGKVLHISEVHQILTNKFYIGIMKYKDEYYEGSHKCFISKELFKKVQEERERRIRASYKSHTFPFVGLMKCKECGASITAEQHTKFYKTKNRHATYVYYRCTKKIAPCTQQAVTAPEIETQVRKSISDVALPISWANKWTQWIKEDETVEKQNTDVNLKNLKIEIENLDKKLNILLDSYLDQVIDPQIYKQKKNEIFEKKLRIQEEITKIESGGSLWLEPFKDFIQKAKTGAKIAHGKNNCEEVALFAKNIGSNFFLHNRKLTANYKSEFDFLRAPAIARNVSDPMSACVGDKRVGLVHVLSRIRKDGAFEVNYFQPGETGSQCVTYKPDPRVPGEITRIDDNSSYVLSEMIVKNVTGWGSRKPRIVKLKETDEQTRAAIKAAEEEGLGMFSYQFGRADRMRR